MGQDIGNELDEQNGTVSSQNPYCWNTYVQTQSHFNRHKSWNNVFYRVVFVISEMSFVFCLLLQSALLKDNDVWSYFCFHHLKLTFFLFFGNACLIEISIVLRWYNITWSTTTLQLVPWTPPRLSFSVSAVSVYTIYGWGLGSWSLLLTPVNDSLGLQDSGLCTYLSPPFVWPSAGLQFLIAVPSICFSPMFNYAELWEIFFILYVLTV